MFLNCKTYFSLRYGTISTRQLVTLAAHMGITSMALTNINGTCDMWDFVKYCQEEGIKPIAGVEIRNGEKLLYILLAANSKGLQWIHEFLSLHLLAKKEFPEDRNSIFFEDYSDGFVIYPMDTKPLKDLLINERIGVLPWEVNNLFSINLKKYAGKFVVRQPVTV